MDEPGGVRCALFREWQVLGDNNRLIAEAAARRKADGPA